MILHVLLKKEHDISFVYFFFHQTPHHRRLVSIFFNSLFFVSNNYTCTLYAEYAVLMYMYAHNMSCFESYLHVFSERYCSLSSESESECKLKKFEYSKGSESESIMMYFRLINLHFGI